MAMPTIMMPAPTDVMMLSVAMDLFGLAKRTAMMAMELIPTPVSIIAKLLNAVTAFYARIFLSMKLVTRSVMTVMVMMQIIVLITVGVPNVVMGFVVQILTTTIPTMKRAMMTTILMVRRLSKQLSPGSLRDDQCQDKEPGEMHQNL